MSAPEIPDPRRLDAIRLMREGDLTDVPFAILLHAQSLEKRSAVLEIERGPLHKTIVLERGLPVDCTSNLLHETLGRFMAARGDLSEDDYQRILAKSATTGTRFGDTLITEGLITPTELYRVLQQNLAKKLLDGFTWRSGHFRLNSDSPDPRSPLKVKVAQLVVTGISKLTPQEEVNGAIRPFIGQPLFLHPDPPHPLSDIRLSADQRRLVDMLGAGKRLDELAAETTISFDDITRLIYGLGVIGIVVPEPWLPVRKKEPAPVAEPIVVAAPPANADLDPNAMREDLMATYLKHRTLDAFDLLGLEETSDVYRIETAYLEHARRFAPWRFERAGLEAMIDKAEELFLAIGRAFGELSDGERRNELIERRRRLRSETAKKADPNRFVIKTNLLDSETQFRRGRELMAEGRYKEARTQLQFAHDVDPQNSMYRAELAWCRYLEDSALWGDDAVSELREALRIDARQGLAHLYLGEVLGDRGEIDEARGHLETALRLMSGDRRPIEALKTLQQRGNKKKRSWLPGS